jgi:tyrosine-protein phosphatase YwqE
MIDMHLRILPGIGDGPETMEGSLALARALVQEGVHNDTMVPHSNDEFHRHTVGETQMRVSDVQDAHGLGKRPWATKQPLEIATQLLGQAETQQVSEGRPTLIMQNAEVSMVSTWQCRQERGM